MKTASLLIMFFILSINIYSQSGYPEPLRTGKQFLVHSAGLPEEFLLFSPDTASQILFNPARANDFSKNFIYVNYLSDNNYSYYYPIYYTGGEYVVIKETGGLKKAAGFNFPQIYQESFATYKSPTFSAAALINSGNAKWLFELSNGINTSGSSLNYFDNSTAVTEPRIWYSNNHNTISQENRSDGTLTSFKISRIFKSGDLNLSAGAFGIILTDNDNGNILNTSENYYFKNIIPFDSVRYRDYSLASESAQINENGSRYVIGLEFTAGSGLFDYVGSIDYQFGDNSYKNNHNLNTYSYDSSRYSPDQQWNFQRREEFRTSSVTSSQKPSVLNFSNYFRHKLGMIDPDDNAFISVNAFYSSGNISYLNNYERIYRNYWENEITGDTTTTTNSDNYDINDWGLTVSAGYALGKKVDDLSFLTGFRIIGNVEHLDGLSRFNVGSIEGGFVKESWKPSMFSITLPVYVDYSPAEWVSVFGGINYSYVYRNNKTQQEMNILFKQSSPSTETNEELTFNTIVHGWHSYKSIYFGCVLRHSSGLRAQFLFDRDITYVPGWNVSLGYEL